MAVLALLECFDAQTPQQEPVGPSDDYVAGHLAGLAEGRALAESDQTRLSADIAQSIADLAFGYTEARQHLVSSLGPLFTALMNRLLPDLAEATLPGHLAAMIQQAAERDMQAPVRLCVHPDRLAAVQGLTAWSRMPLVLCGDPTLGSGQAFLASGPSETMLDIDAVTEAAREVLAAMIASPEQRVDHG